MWWLNLIEPGAGMYKFQDDKGTEFTISGAKLMGVKGMTRQQAAEKLLNLGYENSMLIAALEALGLLKFEEKITLERSSRPIEWASLKRDMDAMANDIINSHNPIAMKEAIRHFKYMKEELDTVE